MLSSLEHSYLHLFTIEMQETVLKHNLELQQMVIHNERSKIRCGKRLLEALHAALDWIRFEWPCNTDSVL